MLLRAGIARINVRVIPPGQLSKRLLNVAFRSCTNNFQDNIKIVQSAHKSSSLLLLLIVAVDILRIDDVAIRRLRSPARCPRGAIGITASTRLAGGSVHGLEGFV